PGCARSSTWSSVKKLILLPDAGKGSLFDPRDYMHQRIYDLSDIVADRRAEHDADFVSVELVLCLEESGKIRSRGLQRFGQRVSDAGGHPIVSVFQPRILDGEAANHIHRERPVHGSFQRVSGEFAITLCGVAVSDEQQGSGVEHRQINSRTFHQLVVVHVAAEIAEIAGKKRKLLLRCDSHAAEHWP